MLQWLRAFLLLVCLVVLSGCEVNQSPDLKTYLLENPTVLRNELTDCQENKLPAARCLAVSSAATEFNALLDAAQRNPQAFGDRILQAQMQMANTGQSTENVKVLLAVVALTLHE